MGPTKTGLNKKSGCEYRIRNYEQAVMIHGHKQGLFQDLRHITPIMSEQESR